MFKRKIFYLVIIITSVFFILGCKTTPAQLTIEGAPEWVNIWYNNDPSNNLSDGDYFFGVGFSNTGNDIDDINNAKKRAFSELSLIIFKNIKESQKDLLPIDAEEKYFGSAEAHIVQSLTRNYTDIKDDFYYSEERGTWYYYKILKSDWARIEKEEKQEIADFLEEVLSSRILSKEINEVELLTYLANGWKFIAESPYPEIVAGALANEKGVLIDLIENNIARVFSRLTINIETNNISTEPWRTENFIFSIFDKEGRKPGELRIDIYNKADGKKITEVTTGKDGKYSDKVEFKNLPLGKHRLYAEISMPFLEINPLHFKNKTTVPSREFNVTVNEISVVLKLVINGEAEIKNFIEQTKKLFSNKELEIRFSPGNRNEKYTINFTINFWNQPRNFHNLVITNANATVDLFKEDYNVFTYKSQEYREVGYDWDKAQERVVIKMFSDISNDENFFKELHKALYANFFK